MNVWHDEQATKLTDEELVETAKRRGLTRGWRTAVNRELKRRGLAVAR